MILRFHKFSRYLYLKGFYRISRVISFLIRIIFSCDLKGSVKIDKNVSFYHNGLGVVIHSRAHIKSGTSIYQNVTIGGNGKDEIDNGVPQIEKNVTISAGAVILGPVIIGANSIIAANAVVSKSIPRNSIAAGVPAKVIKRLD